MKKSVYAFLFVVLGLLTIASVNAAILIPEINLGSSTQERGVAVTGSFTITNTDVTPVTLTLTSTIPSTYGVQMPATVTVPANGSLPVSLTLNMIPLSQNSGKNTIGSITASNNAGVIATPTVALTTVSKLEITKVSAEIDGDSNSLNNNEDMDAKPGDTVKLTVTVKNKFTGNIDIEDVTVTVQQDDLDWDEDDDLSTIRDGDKETSVFSLKIDKDIDSDDYDVDITADGTDENGARHSDTYSITFNVDKKSHELTIRSYTVTPTVVSCDRTITASIDVENTGNNDEDAVVVQIKNDLLKLEQVYKPLTIDTGNNWRKTVTFQIPDTAAPGEYYFEAWTYYDGNEQSDTGVVPVVIQKCGTDPITPTSKCTNLNQQFCVTDSAYQKCLSTGVLSAIQYCPTGYSCQQGQCTQISVPVIPDTGISGPSYGTRSFFDSPVYLAALIIVAVVLVILILVLLIKFVF